MGNVADIEARNWDLVLEGLESLSKDDVPFIEAVIAARDEFESADSAGRLAVTALEAAARYEVSVSEAVVLSLASLVHERIG